GQLQPDSTSGDPFPAALMGKRGEQAAVLPLPASYRRGVTVIRDPQDATTPSPGTPPPRRPSRTDQPPTGHRRAIRSSTESPARTRARRAPHPPHGTTRPARANG